MESRPTRDEIYMGVAHIVGLRGTCLRAKVGAVATVGNRIVAMGYNGALPGKPHCTSKTCTPFDHCPNSVHAEANLITFAARKGISLEGGTIYVTHSPCKKCSELIISSGISKVIYDLTYQSSQLEIFIGTGVKIEHFMGKDIKTLVNGVTL